MSDIVAVAEVRIELHGSAVDPVQVRATFSTLSWLEVTDWRADFGFVALFVPHTRDWRSVPARTREVLRALRDALPVLQVDRIEVGYYMASALFDSCSFDHEILSLLADLGAPLSVRILALDAPESSPA